MSGQLSIVVHCLCGLSEGDFWHHDPYRVEAEEVESVFQVGTLLLSSYISIKCSSLKWTVHQMQLFLLFSKAIANGVKSGNDSQGPRLQEQSHNSSSGIDARLSTL